VVFRELKKSEEKKAGRGEQPREPGKLHRGREVQVGVTLFSREGEKGEEDRKEKKGGRKKLTKVIDQKRDGTTAD